MITRLIRTLFLLLFFLLPLLVSTKNSELFELPKMYFVYMLTIIIVCLHLLNYIYFQHPLTRPSPLNFTLLLFFLSQFFAFIFSIDHYVSFFGYYGRFNGGILSLISYLFLFLILNSYLTSDLKFKLIYTSLISGCLVSFYAITQHFGIDKNLWVQDVQSRVFSTLGQPNWLAGYLAILLPLALFLKSPIKYLILALYSLALIFTKSKTGLSSVFIIFLLYFFSQKKYIFTSLLVIVGLLIGIYFIKSKPTTPTIIDGERLIITNSANIRQLVWTGAFRLIQQYPLIGTGPETFAQSYYWTRPIEHNLTSEWNFLYNKAHNEYLNYAATTGLLGLFAYLFLIFTQLRLTFKENFLIFLSLTSILINNLTGFSVVVVSIYFFLLPLLCPKSS